MKRWLLIFLMVMLPLQMSWAAVCISCQDEQTTSSAGGTPMDRQDDAKVEKLAVNSGPVIADCDCHYCHHFSAGAFFIVVTDIIAPPIAGHDLRTPLAPPSHIPDTLFKPDWRRSA